VEVQATAEGAPFSRDELDEMLEVGALGIDEISAAQRAAAEAVHA
jgi:ribonuclease PH